MLSLSTSSVASLHWITRFVSCMADNTLTHMEAIIKLSNVWKYVFIPMMSARHSKLSLLLWSIRPPPFLPWNPKRSFLGQIGRNPFPPYPTWKLIGLRPLKIFIQFFFLSFFFSWKWDEIVNCFWNLPAFKCCTNHNTCNPTLNATHICLRKDQTLTTSLKVVKL